MKFLDNITENLKAKSFRQLVANFRNEYISDGINEASLKSNPIDQFEIWFNEAVSNKIVEPNVMYLSTVSRDGKPSGRVILLKEFTESGFVFFTNYESRKGDELLNNHYAALTFLWLPLYRQVRIEGIVEKITAEKSDLYFNSRPRSSQIGALASAQSTIISSREELELKAKLIETNYHNQAIPRPEYWGGYCVVPTQIEFWQGRASRLHDRILYELKEDKVWHKSRLSP